MVASAASSGDFMLMVRVILDEFKTISLQSSGYALRRLVAVKLRTFSFDDQIAGEAIVVKACVCWLIILFL